MRWSFGRLVEGEVRNGLVDLTGIWRFLPTDRVGNWRPIEQQHRRRFGFWRKHGGRNQRPQQQGRDRGYLDGAGRCHGPS
jgi:hypothetical protein